MATSSPTEGVPRALRPLVWLTAVLWLPVRDRVLAWVSAVDDAVTRLGRRLGRALAPVGRAVTR